MSKYDALQPKAVWQIFGKMAAIPHGSGDDGRISRLRVHLPEHAARVRSDVQVGDS